MNKICPFRDNRGTFNCECVEDKCMAWAYEEEIYDERMKCFCKKAPRCKLIEKE